MSIVSTKYHGPTRSAATELMLADFGTCRVDGRVPGLRDCTMALEEEEGEGGGEEEEGGGEEEEEEEEEETFPPTQRQ